MTDYRLHEMTYAEIAGIIRGLEARIARLETLLEESKADSATQAAFLRDGYRSKTGEIL